MNFSPEQIEAWLDGELPPEEAAKLDALAATDPFLQQQKQAHLAYLAQVNQAKLTPPSLPYPEFFMQKLSQQIEAETRALTPNAATSTTANKTTHKFWRTLPWAITALCASMMVALLLHSGDTNLQNAPQQVAETENSTLHFAYSSRAEVHNKQPANSTRIHLVLEGLPEYKGEINSNQTASTSPSSTDIAHLY